MLLRLRASSCFPLPVRVQLTSNFSCPRLHLSLTRATTYQPQGALLRGVQLFNEQMLSSCRTDGFLDLSTTSPICTSLGGSLRYAPRQGCAAQMLRDLLALDQSHAVEAETGAEPDENGLQRNREEEAGCGGEGKTVASPASRCQVDACSS